MADTPTSPIVAVLLGIIAALPPLIKMAGTKISDLGRQSRRVREIVGARKEIGFWNARADLLAKVLTGDDLTTAKMETAASVRAVEARLKRSLDSFEPAPKSPSDLWLMVYFCLLTLGGTIWLIHHIRWYSAYAGHHPKFWVYTAILGFFVYAFGGAAFIELTDRKKPPADGSVADKAAT